ncbi:MAG: ATP-binding protein [Tangfeifania sp.]
MALKLDFIIEGGNFSKAGKASSQIKKVLKQLDIDTRIIKSIVVAIYEAEVNVVAHAYSGKLTAGIGENEIEVVVADKGPGIEDIGKAMEAGFSTASKEVREMGFGAGMGLPNIKKNTDEMNIESKMGEGTTLRFKCFY